MGARWPGRVCGEGSNKPRPVAPCSRACTHTRHPPSGCPPAPLQHKRKQDRGLRLACRVSPPFEATPRVARPTTPITPASSSSPCVPPSPCRAARSEVGEDVYSCLWAGKGGGGGGGGRARLAWQGTQGGKGGVQRAPLFTAPSAAPAREAAWPVAPTAQLHTQQLFGSGHRRARWHAGSPCPSKLAAARRRALGHDGEYVAAVAVVDYVACAGVRGGREKEAPQHRSALDGAAHTATSANARGAAASRMGPAPVLSNLFLPGLHVHVREPAAWGPSGGQVAMTKRRAAGAGTASATAAVATPQALTLPAWPPAPPAPAGRRARC